MYSASSLDLHSQSYDAISCSKPKHKFTYNTLATDQEQTYKTCFVQRSSTTVIVRHLLSLSDNQFLDKLSDSDIAKLLYRDHLKVKHSTRKRLAGEIAEKEKQLSIADKSHAAVKDRQCDKPNVTSVQHPLTKALKEYLLRVSCQLATKLCLCSVLDKFGCHLPLSFFTVVQG